MKLKQNYCSSFLCQCKKCETFRKIMYDNVENSLISYSDPYVTFFNLLTSHDGHLLTAVGYFFKIVQLHS